MVHMYAAVDASAVIEPGAVVFPGARVAAGCRVGACSVVGPGCTLGEETQLAYGVTMSHARVGARCVLHQGVRLGADGFGFTVDPATGAVAKKPQTWGVILGDDVELGANTCVDRGSWRDTRVGDGTKVRRKCVAWTLLRRRRPDTARARPCYRWITSCRLVTTP